MIKVWTSRKITSQMDKRRDHCQQDNRMNLRRNIYRLLGHVKLNLDGKRSTLSVINLLIIIPYITRDNNKKNGEREGGKCRSDLYLSLDFQVRQQKGCDGRDRSVGRKSIGNKSKEKLTLAPSCWSKFNKERNSREKRIFFRWQKQKSSEEEEKDAQRKHGRGAVARANIMI